MNAPIVTEVCFVCDRLLRRGEIKYTEIARETVRRGKEKGKVVTLCLPCNWKVKMLHLPAPR